jgi:hypothetical protein
VKAGRLGVRILERLSIRNSFDRHVFAIEGLDPRVRTIICSEKFYVSAKGKGVKGIDFVPIESARWPNPNSFVFDPEEVLSVL